MREKGPRSGNSVGVGARTGAGVGAGVKGEVAAGAGTRLMVVRRRLGEDMVDSHPSVVVVTVVETMTAPKSSAPGMRT
jgi:hypothetical protein